ncbi:MAG: DNA topoisomerase IB [Cyanobacteria bacterium J06636_16]
MSKSPAKVAKRIGLRYVTDQIPGIRRQKVGRGFSYFDVEGHRIQNSDERDRLKQLAIPPSWQDVWICPFENGHLLATGRDAKGRKQYRYHPEWCQVRNQAKFDRMIAFGRALPAIRQQTEKHMHLQGLPREKVLALVVQLLENTLIRVGNVAYARNNKSYGLTTLRTRHIDIAGNQVEFEFTGKSGVEHHIELEDKHLVAVIKRCYEIPGYTVFQYLDEEGQRQQVDSGEVNDYLQEITGEDFTAKEFRTWAGTVLTAQELGNLAIAQANVKAQQQVTDAIKAVAKQLGNRPATCRKYYVHPKVPEAHLAGELLPRLQSPRQSSQHLELHECVVLELLAS